MSTLKSGSAGVGAAATGYRAYFQQVTSPVARDRFARPKAATEPGSGLSGAVWAKQYRAKLRLTDLTVILVVTAAAVLAPLAGDNAIPGLAAVPADSWAVSAIVAATWALTLSMFRTRDARVISIGAPEYKLVINASTLAFGMLAIAFLLLQVDTARPYFVLALPLGVTALLLERWLWRKWLIRQRRFGHSLAKALVVGGADDVEYVIRQIDQKFEAGYHIVGAALEANGISIRSGGRLVPVVADFAHVAAAAKLLGVDAVIVAGHPSLDSTFIRALAWDLEKTNADLVLSSRLTDVAGPRIHFRPVEGLPLIHVEIPNFSGAKYALKRTLDVVAAALGILLLLPLLIVVAIIIRIDSPGPVLFRQVRCGRNGDTFYMLKFRSMVRTAEDDLASLLDKNEASGVLFKIRNDPRITRFGRFIRKYSIDELPQLWNVLVGEMSLVGPRPPLPAEVEGYETHVHRRLYIKPGVTGMWQINGRSNLSWEDSVRLDLYYVENWSLAGDLMILWRTFKTVIQPQGAY
ncbi:sugar transferase [Cryobacterium sp. TMT2-14]|uniref:sugar transferase n=1 Tax=Cryobacterium sp. TMT2-14 TaxID=1259245 RepID=UPI00106B4D77|nr:sugar transferase [Cryobacterium sp. TMT2-14]TFC36370.1 sugar transferase [Cryobacterium sp. TMT2-14]